MPDGSLQTTPVWCNSDGEDILVNTMRNFRKAKNMCQNPKVTLLVYDPKNPLRNIEIRGLVVEMTEEGAVDHLNELTCLYMKKPEAVFFGDCVPTDYQTAYFPMKVRIRPSRVRVEG
jgi:hypothetical protein